MAGTKSIPHFTGGSVGAFTFTHLNSMVDRLNSLSDLLPVFEKSGSLQQKLLLGADKTGMTIPILARLGEPLEKSDASPWPCSGTDDCGNEDAATEFIAYPWEEVALDNVNCKFTCEIAGAQRKAVDPKGEEPAEDSYAICMDAPGNKDFAGKVVLLYKFATEPYPKDDEKEGLLGKGEEKESLSPLNIYLFSFPTGLGAVAGMTVDGGGAGGDGGPYLLKVLEYDGGWNFADPVKHIYAYNMVEMFGFGDLGNSIVEGSCDNTGDFETQRIQTNKGLVVHRFPGEHGIRAPEGVLNLDPGVYAFHVANPVKVICTCSSGLIDGERAKYGFSLDAAQIMMGAS